jgi:hypothetical protein
LKNEVFNKTKEIMIDFTENPLSLHLMGYCLDKILGFKVYLIISFQKTSESGGWKPPNPERVTTSSDKTDRWKINYFFKP